MVIIAIVFIIALTLGGIIFQISRDIAQADKRHRAQGNILEGRNG